MSYVVDGNGNYKRTVRCGYCYELGHNKGSCEQKKQNHKDHIAEYEKEIADDNFADDYERRHAERCLERHRAEISKSANRGKNRKCSYCKGPGHTRRTCSFRKGDMNDYAVKCITAREKFVENMTAIGLAVGALGYRKNSWGENAVLTIVESISWNYLTHNTAIGEHSQYQEIITARSFQPTEYNPSGASYGVMLPPSVANISGNEVGERFKNRCFELVSPAEPSIPEDFLTLESAMHAAKLSKEFDEQRPYSYTGTTYDEE